MAVFGKGVFVHHCRDQQCCMGIGPYDWSVTAEKIAAVATELFFSASPKAPEANKWTLLGPAIDWFLAGFLACDVLELATRVAFDGWTVGADDMIPVDDPQQESAESASTNVNKSHV